MHYYFVWIKRNVHGCIMEIHFLLSSVKFRLKANHPIKSTTEFLLTLPTVMK